MSTLAQSGYGWSKRGFSLPPGGIEGIGASQQQDASTVGTALLSTAKYAGPAAPFVAAAGAIADIVSLFGPNPSNNYATEVVNQVQADGLQPNLSAWQALPTAQKTLVNQAAAEANFNTGWAYILQACNNPALGSAGINCIKDRQRGGKYDFWAMFYDPIATDPAPAANAALAAEAAASTTANGSNSTTGSPSANGANTTTTTTTPASTPNLYLWGGIGLLAFALMVGLGGD